MAKRPPLSDKALAAAKRNKHPDWKPGQSGNPKGKPAGTKNRSTILREILELTFKRINPETGKIEDMKNPLDPAAKKMTIEQAIDVALVQKALKGNIEAIKEVKDTLHGKIKDVTEIIQPDVTPKEVEEMTDEEAQAAYDGLLKGK